MFKLTTKNVAMGYSYVYAQRSERISSTKVKTESYSLGNVHDFIARLNSKLVGSKTEYAQY
ncbi:MAG: hypothetical protein QMD06_00765 [Candidatus Altarchaeum sp.]|nr:hypothetical protein [Candidatus Altarchaeum sp.]